MTIKESDIQKAVQDYLDYRGIFNTRINSGFVKKGKYTFRGAKSGFPDVLVLYKGKFIGLEIKTPTGKQGASQIAMQKEIEDNGGEYYIVRSIDDVQAIF